MIVLLPVMFKQLEKLILFSNDLHRIQPAGFKAFCFGKNQLLPITIFGQPCMVVVHGEWLYLC